MTTTEKKNNLVEISTDESHILHRIGFEEYQELRRATIAAADLANWEEIAVSDIPPYTEAEYKAKVTELIRERYSADDEFALINNVMANITEKRQSEYAAYQEFREECKRRAKEILTTENTGNNND